MRVNRAALSLALAFSSGLALGMGFTWAHFEVKANERFKGWVDARVKSDLLAQEMRAKRTIPQIQKELAEDLEEVAEIRRPYIPTTTYGEFEIITDAEYEFINEYDKIVLEIFRDDKQYQLVMDGEAVIDWGEVLTPDVIEALKGQEELYIRNNRKKEDYYVTWGRP